MAATDPDRVRMLVVADYDAGFALTARSPLPDVEPGGSYVTEIFPQRSVTIYEVLVEGFTLVQISVGTRTVAAEAEEHGPRRLYRLDEPLTVVAGESACLHLCNASDEPRKQKSATLIADRRRNDPPHHGDRVKTYRCKHAVEAMRWTDTDENREAFATWLEKHDAVFETRGPIALLPDLITRAGCDTDRVEPGEWIIFSDGEFIAMEDELFRDDYEEIA